nr:hypothetical protein GCM10020093_110980 [Planobispora longispora]
MLTEPVTYPGALESFREAAARFRTAAVPSGSGTPGSGTAGSGTAGSGTAGSGTAAAGAVGYGATGSGTAGSGAVEFGAALAARPALAYLIPTGHNPTGSVMPSLIRRRLAGLAAEHDVPLIDDEVPAELCFSGEPPPPLCSFHPGEQIITVGSLSKLVWGGLRIGWIRAAEPVISRLARLRSVHDLGGDVLSQLAAARLLARVGELRRERVAVLRRRHGHLLAELARALPDWSAEPALGGQTVWVRLPHGDADAFAQVALRHRVAVPPGRAFDPLGGHDAFLRLPFLLPEQELSSAVDRLAAAWQDYDGSSQSRVLHPWSSDAPGGPLTLREDRTAPVAEGEHDSPGQHRRGRPAAPRQHRRGRPAAGRGAPGPAGWCCAPETASGAHVTGIASGAGVFSTVSSRSK